MSTFTKLIRLFIDGLLDDPNAAVVNAHARSLADVVHCQVVPSGLCTIQVSLNTVTADIEYRLIQHLTFDKYDII